MGEGHRKCPQSTWTAVTLLFFQSPRVKVGVVPPGPYDAAQDNGEAWPQETSTDRLLGQQIVGVFVFSLVNALNKDWKRAGGTSGHFYFLSPISTFRQFFPSGGP